MSSAVSSSYYTLNYINTHLYCCQHLNSKLILNWREINFGSMILRWPLMTKLFHFGFVQVASHDWNGSRQWIFFWIGESGKHVSSKFSWTLSVYWLFATVTNKSFIYISIHLLAQWEPLPLLIVCCHWMCQLIIIFSPLPTNLRGL